jgi:hypothetical protein
MSASAARGRIERKERESRDAWKMGVERWPFGASQQQRGGSIKMKCTDRKLIVGFGAVLLVACMALLVFGEEMEEMNDEGIVSIEIADLRSIEPATTVIIGPVTICTTNGNVTIDERFTPDEASKVFWFLLEQNYPEMFPGKD